MSEPKKPMLMRREEFIGAVTQAVNGYDLPPILMHPILKDILDEVEAAIRREYDAENAEYAKELEKFSAQAEVNDDG